MVPVKQMAAQYDPASPKVKGVIINEIAVPEVRPKDILIRTTSASLCHSDMAVINGRYGYATGEPITIGHEGTGQIVALGSIAAARGFNKDDFIGFINAYDACFDCEGCATHYSNCTSGNMVQKGFQIHGFFQEYSTVDSSVAIVLPDGLDPYESSPLFCAGTTAFQGVLAGNAKPGQWMAIVGCGGLGQVAIRYAIAMGFRVIGIDIDESTLRIAKESGAEYTFNSRAHSDLAQEVKKITSGGCHACVVFTAVKPGYDTALECIRIGGTLVPVGITRDPIVLSTFDLTMKKYSISAAANIRQPSDLKLCADFSVKHNITSPSRFFRLEQIHEMIDIMRKHKLGGNRLVVKFDKSEQQSRI